MCSDNPYINHDQPETPVEIHETPVADLLVWREWLQEPDPVVEKDEEEG